MDPQVLRQVRLLPEALPALRTPVRPTVRVDAFVLQQSALLLKVLAAGGTLEQAQVRVLPLAVGRRRRVVHVVDGGGAAR